MTALVETGLATLMAMHDAFRRDLERLVAATAVLAQAERTRPAMADATAIERYWTAFEIELHDHHRVEDDEIYVQVAASVGHEASPVLAAMATEHDELVAAIDRARQTVEALVADPTAERAAHARDAITAAQQVTTAHLAHEERDCVPLIRRAADDAYMAAFLERRQAEAVPPRFLPWLLDGAPADVAARITSPLPPPVQALLAEQWQPARAALVASLPQA
ncbi:MAG: hemerythrin [Acidimicrobiales bacterium]|nr:hemerythrin [Acidimicrobiales bacterium]